jgi:hypothetical protein
MVERVKDATEQAKAGSGYAGAISEEAYRRGQATLPFEESRAPEGPVRPTGAQTLKPFRPPQNTYAFTVEDPEGNLSQTVQLQAANRPIARRRGKRDSANIHCSFARSALASLRMGMSGSASFQGNLGRRLYGPASGRLRHGYQWQPHAAQKVSVARVGADVVKRWSNAEDRKPKKPAPPGRKHSSVGLTAIFSERKPVCLFRVARPNYGLP